MNDTLQAKAIADLESFAKEIGYEVIGSTVLIGSQQESIAELSEMHVDNKRSEEDRMAMHQSP